LKPDSPTRPDSFPPARPSPYRRAFFLAALATLTTLAACGTPGFAPFGPGPADRTFNAPVARVRMAALSALSRLKIRHVGTDKVKEGEVLKGVAEERKIEVTLEPLGPGSTRVRVKGDSATATAILTQTERLLGKG
jgi:hypothetical protein